MISSMGILGLYKCFHNPVECILSSIYPSIHTHEIAWGPLDRLFKFDTAKYYDRLFRIFEFCSDWMFVMKSCIFFCRYLKRNSINIYQREKCLERNILRAVHFLYNSYSFQDSWTKGMPWVHFWICMFSGHLWSNCNRGKQVFIEVSFH
jgi:hypothetical protein